MNLPPHMFQKIAVIANTIICHQYYFNWTIKIWKKNHQKNYFLIADHQSSFDKIIHWRWSLLCINVFEYWECTFHASWRRLQEIAEVGELSPSRKWFPLWPKLNNIFEHNTPPLLIKSIFKKISLLLCSKSI